MRASWALLLTAVATGCVDAEETARDEPAPCENGSCQAAGIPPELCGVGFEPSAEMACTPILPVEPCPPGLMATPGETACREIAPCAPGTWGDIAVDASTEHVDGAYAGGGSDGTAARPWTTIQAGIDAAVAGAIVAVAEGSYAEDVSIQGKPVRLWGRCPGMVAINGTASALGAVVVTGGAAAGTELHRLTVRGAAVGVAVSGALDVVVDAVWIHQTASRGLDVEDALGPTRVAVRGSLVEETHELAIHLSGVEVSIDASVVRGTLPAPDASAGRAINVQPDPARSLLTVRSSLIEQNHEIGIFISGSDATIESTVVRSTRAQASDRTAGRGILIQNDTVTGERASVLVRSSFIDDNLDGGIVVVGSDATIEATVVRGTQGRESDLLFGRGIEIEDDPVTGARSSVAVRWSAVTENRECGVMVLGSDGTIEATIVERTLPRAVDQAFGRGITLQANDMTGARATGAILLSLIDANAVVGIGAVGADVSIDGTTVRATAAQAADGLFGDGVIADWRDGSTNVIVAGSSVEQSARAGIASFGANITLEGTTLECNAIHLNGETGQDVPSGFDDAGGNSCGCAGESVECKVASSGLEPPAPLP